MSEYAKLVAEQAYRSDDSDPDLILEGTAKSVCVEFERLLEYLGVYDSKSQTLRIDGTFQVYKYPFAGKKYFELRCGGNCARIDSRILEVVKKYRESKRTPFPRIDKVIFKNLDLSSELTPYEYVFWNMIVPSDLHGDTKLQISDLSQNLQSNKFKTLVSKLWRRSSKKPVVQEILIVDLLVRGGTHMQISALEALGQRIKFTDWVKDKGSFPVASKTIGDQEETLEDATLGDLLKCVQISAGIIHDAKVKGLIGLKALRAKILAGIHIVVERTSLLERGRAVLDNLRGDENLADVAEHGIVLYVADNYRRLENVGRRMDAMSATEAVKRFLSADFSGIPLPLNMEKMKEKVSSLKNRIGELDKWSEDFVYAVRSTIDGRAFVKDVRNFMYMLGILCANISTLAFWTATQPISFVTRVSLASTRVLAATVTGKQKYWDQARETVGSISAKNKDLDANRPMDESQDLPRVFSLREQPRKSNQAKETVRSIVSVDEDWDARSPMDLLGLVGFVSYLTEFLNLAESPEEEPESVRFSETTTSMIFSMSLLTTAFGADTLTGHQLSRVYESFTRMDSSEQMLYYLDAAAMFALSPVMMNFLSYAPLAILFAPTNRISWKFRVAAFPFTFRPPTPESLTYGLFSRFTMPFGWMSAVVQKMSGASSLNPVKIYLMSRSYKQFEPIGILQDQWATMQEKAGKAYEETSQVNPYLLYAYFAVAMETLILVLSAAGLIPRPNSRHLRIVSPMGVMSRRKHRDPLWRRVPGQGYLRRTFGSIDMFRVGDPVANWKYFILETSLKLPRCAELTVSESRGVGPLTPATMDVLMLLDQTCEIVLEFSGEVRSDEVVKHLWDIHSSYRIYNVSRVTIDSAVFSGNVASKLNHFFSEVALLVERSKGKLFRVMKLGDSLEIYRARKFELFYDACSRFHLSLILDGLFTCEQFVSMFLYEQDNHLTAMELRLHDHRNKGALQSIVGARPPQKTLDIKGWEPYVFEFERTTFIHRLQLHA